MLRPSEIRHGVYVATIAKEEITPWGICTTWTILRNGVTKVGSMFQGGMYAERPYCSMSALVWSGPQPEGVADPKSEHYGMCFDTGPYDTREEALAAFARRADRLIAWRKRT